MKKPLMIVICACILGGIGAMTYILISPSRVETPKDKMVTEDTQKVKLLTWDDPAGFTFSYPDGTVVNKHDEDQQNYAHVEMTHPDYKGSIIVWAKDLPKGVSDVATWVKKDAGLSLGVTLDTTLGDAQAAKVLISQPDKRMVIGAVYDGLLFYIEGVHVDEKYWETAINTVSGSFKFTPIDASEKTAPAAAANSMGSDGGSVDEEETLE